MRANTAKADVIINAASKITNSKLKRNISTREIKNVKEKEREREGERERDRLALE